MAKVAVITGASGGIGEALAHTLAARGHRLVLAARRAQELQRVAASVGTEVLAIPTDVRRRQQVEHLKDAALARFGRVDVWVNNAGRGISRAVLALSERELDEMLAVNTRSALFGMQAIVPHFQERGEGHLINVSAFLSRVSQDTGRSAYDAAKAALNALTVALRTDLRRSHPGVHVTLVLPDKVSTGFSRNALGGEARGPEAGPPAQTAEEVAEAIAQVIETPAAEVYTRPTLAKLAQRYLADVEDEPL